VDQPTDKRQKTEVVNSGAGGSPDRGDDAELVDRSFSAEPGSGSAAAAAHPEDMMDLGQTGSNNDPSRARIEREPPAEKKQRTETASASSAHPWFDVQPMPSPPPPSTYIQVGRLVDESVSNSWHVLVGRGAQQCYPAPGVEYFTSTESESSYDHEVGKMFLVKRREDPDGIKFQTLSDADKATFLKARCREIEALIGKGALKKLSLSESEAFEKKHGSEYVLDSGFVEKWKRTDDDVIAKSRHVIKGWQDPMVLQIERTAPAPTAEDEAAIFQVVASNKWDGYVGDVKNAFGQSIPSNRKTPVACRQPPEGIPGMKPGELLLCVTECYGLVSGPAWWRASLVGWLESVGYFRHPLAPCLMILPGKEGDVSRDKQTDGVMSIRTDDMFEGGEPRHRALMDKMRKRFEFGKYKRLLDDASGTMLNGRRVLQYEDKSFRTHMKEYAKTIRPVKIGRKLKSDDGKPIALGPQELAVCRGVNGGIQWLASNGRPELSQSGIPM